MSFEATKQHFHMLEKNKYSCDEKNDDDNNNKSCKSNNDNNSNLMSNESATALNNARYVRDFHLAFRFYFGACNAIFSFLSMP